MRLPKPVKADLDLLYKEKGCLQTKDVEMAFKVHGVHDIPIEMLDMIWGGISNDRKQNPNG